MNRCSLRIVLTLAIPALTLSLSAQGTISFNTYIPGIVDARVFEWDGVPFGRGFFKNPFNAELWWWPAGSSPLVPLKPATTLKVGGANEAGYVNPVVVTVPGVLPGQEATIVMRVFNGGSYDASVWRAFSNPVTVGPLGGTLADGTTLPPAVLANLKSFSLQIPEISSTYLMALGLVALMLFARRRS